MFEECYISGRTLDGVKKALNILKDWEENADLLQGTEVIIQ